MEIEKWLPSLVVLFSVLLYVIRFYTVVFGTWDISQKHERNYSVDQFCVPDNTRGLTNGRSDGERHKDRSLSKSHSKYYRTIPSLHSLHSTA